MGWNTKGGGGAATSNVDAKARTDAAKALAKIGSIYKVGGDTLAAGDEVFVVMDSGNIINWKNPTAADITIPAKPTVANMKTAGLAQLSGNVAAQDIIQTWQTARSAWAATSQIDFTTSEPAMVAGNLSKIYWSTKTGKGSTSTALTFDNGDLYEIFRNDAGALEWREFVPVSGWQLTLGKALYTHDGTKWVLIPGDRHEHVDICDVTPISSATIAYRVVTGSTKLWRNKTTPPDMSVLFTDTVNWNLKWEDALPATAGVNYKAVADNATLVAKEFSVASPALNVVHHLAFPTVAKDSWFSVINTGKGSVEVGGSGGIQILGEGQLEYTASPDGLSWVLTSKEGAVDIKEIGTGAALPANNTSFSMFILKGHSVLPDSVYWFDAGNSNQWVQL